MELTDINTFVSYYSRIKDRTRRLFPCIPPDKAEWTFKKGRFTIGDIIRHLALTERFMYVENVKGRPSLYEGCGPSYADGLDNIVKYYDELHQESKDTLSTLTTEELNQKCQTPGGHQVTTWKLLRAMVEHEVHHRGQLYTYLSMLDIKTPPIFGLTSEEVIKEGKNQ